MLLRIAILTIISFLTTISISVFYRRPLMFAEIEISRESPRACVVVFTGMRKMELNATVTESEAGIWTWRLFQIPLNNVLVFVSIPLFAWILYKLLRLVKAFTEVE